MIQKKKSNDESSRAVNLAFKPFQASRTLALLIHLDSLQTGLIEPLRSALNVAFHFPHYLQQKNCEEVKNSFLTSNLKFTFDPNQ